MFRKTIAARCVVRDIYSGEARLSLKFAYRREGRGIEKYSGYTLTTMV